MTFKDNPYCPRLSSLGLSDTECSWIQGARTPCTESTNQTVVSEVEQSTDITKVSAGLIFAFPSNLGVGQFLEILFGRQEAHSSKALSLALPENPPQFFQPSFPLFFLPLSTPASQHFSMHTGSKGLNQRGQRESQVLLSCSLSGGSNHCSPRKLGPHQPPAILQLKNYP